jgi:tight adherence protein B
MAEFTVRDLWYALTLSGVFVGLLILLWAGFTLFIEPIRQRRKISRRLSESTVEYMRRVQILKARLDGKPTPMMAVLGIIVGTNRIASLQQRMLQADIYRGPGSFLGIVFLLGGVGFLLGFVILRSLLLGLLFTGIMTTLPFLYLRHKRTQKALLVEKQMPDTMELLARSLRAGHTLPSAVELAGEEVDHPLGTELRIAYEEQRFGLAMHEALSNMLERIDSQDLRYFVTAVIIQSETGGNLVEIMEKIGHVIRGRLNLKSKIRALTAEGRLSGVLLTFLPVVAFFLLITFRYNYESVLLTHKLGQKILLAGVLLLSVGGFFMRKLIQAVET